MYDHKPPGHGGASARGIAAGLLRIGGLGLLTTAMGATLATVGYSAFAGFAFMRAASNDPLAFKLMTTAWPVVWAVAALVASVGLAVGCVWGARELLAGARPRWALGAGLLVVVAPTVLTTSACMGFAWLGWAVWALALLPATLAGCGAVVMQTRPIRREVDAAFRVDARLHSVGTVAVCAAVFELFAGLAVTGLRTGCGGVWALIAMDSTGSDARVFAVMAGIPIVFALLADVVLFGLAVQSFYAARRLVRDHAAGPVILTAIALVLIPTSQLVIAVLTFQMLGVVGWLSLLLFAVASAFAIVSGIADGEVRDAFERGEGPDVGQTSAG